MKNLANKNAKILEKNVAGWVLFVFFCCLIKEVAAKANVQGEFAKSFEDVVLSIKKQQNLNLWTKFC